MNALKLQLRDILVHVEHDGEQYELYTFSNEYRSLMMLIYDRIFAEGFGECRGMGKCGTCLVAIMGKVCDPTSYERNEEINLIKAGYAPKDVRLSCQLLIDEKMNGLSVKILT